MGYGYTLVPQRQVASLADLRPDEMGAVLAGLQRLADRCRKGHHLDGVEILAHPCRPEPGGHVHFHVTGPGGRPLGVGPDAGTMVIADSTGP